MGERTIWRERVSRRLVTGILIFLVAKVLVAENVTLVFNPERVVKGKRFTIQIRTSIPWGEKVEIKYPELNGPMVWWAYPYARPWSIVSNDGEKVRMVEVLASIRVDKPGFFQIDPFRIRSGDREVITDAKEIIGLDSDEADFPYPITLKWRNLPEKIWQEQAVPVVLEARNMVSLTLADSVVLNAAPEGLLEDTHGFGGILTRPRNNDILYDVPMASWMWTPGNPGTHQFPGIQVSVAGLNRRVSPFQVEVLPLPREVIPSGAVGYFTLSTEWKDVDYHVGDIVPVRVKVEGRGNLNVLKLPVPELASARLVSQGSSSSFVPGPHGYEGRRVERYDFYLEKTGVLQLDIPEWSWMEPEGSGNIHTQPVKSGFIQSVEASESNDKKDAEMLLGNELFRYRQADFHWKKPYWFLLVLPGFTVFLIFFFIRRSAVHSLLSLFVLPLLLSASNINVQDTIATVETKGKALEGDWDAARSGYEHLFDKAGEIPGLLNDIAVVEMALGHPDKAVFYIRRALFLRPGSIRLMNTLERLEERFGLSDQVPVSLQLPPALFFSIWIISINLFFLALTRLIFRRNAVDYIILVSMMLLFTASTISCMYSEKLWKQSTAVVKEDSEPLRKIPDPLATDWIQLPAGSAVSITAVERNDYLVRTGYGLEGWLPKTSLILVSEVIDGF